MRADVTIEVEPGSAACPAAPTAHARRHVEHCMGTAFSIHVASPGVDDATLRSAMAWLQEIDAIFSTYRPDSQISLIDAGRLRLDEAAPVVKSVLAECERFRVLTDGYFDVRAAGRLDPSGYVKGWAVQTVADRLTAAGSPNHYVNGGGDVSLAGRPHRAGSWRIGVVDPRDRDTVIRTVVGRGPLGVATSGSAERGPHLFDPHTGRVADGLAGVTVIARGLVTADVFATAAAVMGAERGPAWLATRDDVLLATAMTTAGDVVDVHPSPDRDGVRPVGR